MHTHPTPCIASSSLGAISLHATTDSLSGTHGSVANAHHDPSIRGQQHSCSESCRLRVEKDINVLGHVTGAKCLHGQVRHGLQLEHQVHWPGSLPNVKSTTISAVNLWLILFVIARIHGVGQLTFLKGIFNLIGIVRL
jgi:hypothetical protein